jgi:hypothetical protein
MTTSLLSHHVRSRRYGFKQCTGGVIPVCVDEEKVPWCLLGENHKAELCHFHGWVNPGETFEMGAAREAYEESKGLLGDAHTLWRAISDPNFSCCSGPMVALSLGKLTLADRARMCAEFSKLNVTCRGMTEVKNVFWVALRPLRDHCIYENYAYRAKKVQRVPPSNPLPPGLKIRDFLLHRSWLGSEFWQHPAIHQLLETGVFPDSWQRLQDISSITAGELAHLSSSLALTVSAPLEDESSASEDESSPEGDDLEDKDPQVK